MSSDQASNDQHWEEVRDKARRYYEKEKEINDARTSGALFSRIRELENEKNQIVMEGRVPAVMSKAQDKADRLNIVGFKIAEHRMAIRELEKEQEAILSEP